MKTFDPLKAELDKQELLTGYSALARLPLTAGSVQELPFHAITWQRFESLIFQLVSLEYGPENCTPYGYPGQEQEGLDILISTPGDKYRVYQCKRVQKFTGTEFTNEFNLFCQGEWYNQTSRYYLVSSDPLQDTGFIKAFELKKRELVDKIELIKLGANELNAKLRIQPQLVYDFFGEEYAKHFCRQPELGEFQQRQKPQPVKPIYPAPANYIPRKLSKTGTQEQVEESRQISLFDALCQQIEKQKVSFLIRSNAAYGKTTELIQLVSTVSENFSGLLPLLIKLKHYLPDKHTLTEHLDLLYPNWSNYPQSKTLIVMDGVDEIPIGGFADFTRKISSFLNQYSQVNVIMALRTNFHNSGFVERISENRSFQEFTIDELGPQEISDFALSILKIKKDVTNFTKLCKQKSMDDLLAVPFYLVNLLELFNDKSIGFPKGRREAMDAIIGRRCREDAAKYDLVIQPAALLIMLKELTIVMTLKGLNSIYYSDIRSTVNFDTDQMKLSSLLQLEIYGLDHRISFIHANFQEYLFALSIVNLSSHKLNEILFSNYDRNHLKPKFLNVTNYLFSMMDQNGPEFIELYNRLFDYNFECLALFEKDKISLEDRLTIFDKIIEKYRNQEFYFLRDNLVSSERLWEYINYAPSAFDRLLQYVNTRNDSSCAAFLDLVQKYPANQLLPASNLKLKNLLLEIIENTYDYAIHDRAIDLLVLFEIFDEETFIAIKACPTIHFKMVRAAVFDYIIKWGKAEVELTYLLESAPFFTDKTDRVAAGLEMKYVRTIVDVLDPTNYR
ncbi:MAG: hypothetical protein H7069_04845 [Phormidesmis sp. FL-bin-119]|nr:hypothetical protein [Pedobacter sp.]